MSFSEFLIVGLSVYFGLNFVCALVLHLHAERQAHLPLRFLDVAVHFVLLTAFAIPVLLYVTAEAVFGRGENAQKIASVPSVPQIDARAA